MRTTIHPKRKYRFGLFEADPASGELLRQGVRVRLQDQPFRLLTILLESAGEVVSREELRGKLWPADTYVEFDGSLKAALKKLRDALGDPAENPIFIETIPKRGYRFIAPVGVEEQGGPVELGAVTANAPEPVLPEVTAPAVADASGPSATLSTAKPPSRIVALGAAVFVTIGVIVAVYTIGHRSRPVASPSPLSAALPDRKSVAILGFRNASGKTEDQWLGTAFAEMLSTELATGERLRLVSGEEISNLQLSAPWPVSGTLGRETTNRLGTALNSDVLISGSYTTIGEKDRRQLRLDVRAQDAKTGDVLGQIAQSGAANDVFQITSEIGARLRQQLGVPGISDTEQAGVLASMPLDHEAARFYALGIAKLHEFDARAAKNLLEQACAADPKFSLAHAMLARADGMLGYEQKRKEEAKKALDLSIDLPRTERMQVEGDYYESLPDHAKGSATYSALFELFPESVDYGIQLVNSLNAAERGNQALEIISRLRKLPPPASLDPRIDISESRIASRSADGLALIETAIAKAKAQGKRLLYARARLDQCMQLVYGPHPEQATEPCQDAYDIYQAAGNDLGAADAIRLQGDQQGGEGHVEQARANYQRALKILEGTGEHLKTAVILNNMAIGYTNNGELDRGEQMFREAKFHFEQAGDERNAAIALANIGDILFLRGRLPAAAKTYEQVIATQSRLDDGDPGYAMYRLADVKLTQGLMKEAHGLASQSIEAMRSKDFNLHDALSELASILEAEGDLEGARKQFQAALDIRLARGRGLAVAESQVSLGEIALEEGHPDQAEALTRQAIAEFEKEKSDPDGASAYTLLSRVLLSEGKVEDAGTAVEHAAELSRSDPDPQLKWPLAIQKVRVAGAGSPQRSWLIAALERIRTVISSAHKIGYYQIECDARLAEEELEMKLEPAAARVRLAALAKETHERGMNLVAHEAELAEGSPPLSAKTGSNPH